MVGVNEKLNDQTKICVETLNKIAKVGTKKYQESEKFWETANIREILV
jgi:hypothetical protein